ncbi:MAG: hypothetical protein HY400_00130, partial [Elusimicrobia bacterium]|nr:hypothetical protein [Elusimicrobiota bacterium]
ACTMELRRQEGKTFFLAGAANRLVSPSGEPGGFLIVLRDVTEMRKEEMLKVLQKDIYYASAGIQPVPFYK